MTDDPNQIATVPLHLAAAMARGARERPEIGRDQTLLAQAVRLAKEARPRMGDDFAAHTAVDAHDAHVGDACDARTIALTVVGTWDMETEAHADESASAGLC